MAIENDMLALARTDVELSDLILGTTNDELKQNAAAYHTEQSVEKIIKHLLIQKRGYGNPTHDIGQLVADAKSEKISLPEWVDDNSYVISKWSTTIRYNSNFKTNREKIDQFNKSIHDWIDNIKAQ